MGVIWGSFKRLLTGNTRSSDYSSHCSFSLRSPFLHTPRQLRYNEGLARVIIMVSEKQKGTAAADES